MITTQPTIGIAMASDADWGRLYNFNTTGDAGLVMPFRSYYFRNFFSGGWTDLSMGLIYCACGNTGDTSALINERLPETTPANLPHFGLTSAPNNVIDVANNPNFVGLRGMLNGITQVMTATSNLGNLQLTMVSGGNTNTGGSAVLLPLNQGVTGTPFSALGIRFIHNPSIGRLYVNYTLTPTLALANDADNTTQMLALLNGISPNVGDAKASFALANTSLFSSYYLFWPYLTNKLKLQCVGAIKNG